MRASLQMRKRCPLPGSVQANLNVRHWARSVHLASPASFAATSQQRINSSALVGEQGLAAASAVFIKAGIHPETAASGAFELEGWDIRGFSCFADRLTRRHPRSPSELEATRKVGDLCFLRETGQPPRYLVMRDLHLLLTDPCRQPLGHCVCDVHGCVFLYPWIVSGYGRAIHEDCLAVGGRDQRLFGIHRAAGGLPTFRLGPGCVEWGDAAGPPARS